MKRTIYKYILGGDSKIMMPAGAEILSVQLQRGHVCIWCIVDDQMPKVERHFSAFFTGSGFPDVGESNFKFLATLQDGQGIVVHVFEGQVLN